MEQSSGTKMRERGAGRAEAELEPLEMCRDRGCDR